MPNEKIKEIVDFATSESPYRSANKGWITDQVYLNLGASRDESVKGLDRIVQVSINSKPIIQLLLLVFLVAFISVVLAFAPISLSRGGLHSLAGLLNPTSKIDSPVQKVVSIKAEEVSLKEISDLNEFNDKGIIKPIQNTSIRSLPKENLTPQEINVGKVRSEAPQVYEQKLVRPKPSKRNVLTATDLFQPKR